MICFDGFVHVNIKFFPYILRCKLYLCFAGFELLVIFQAFVWLFAVVDVVCMVKSVAVMQFAV